MNMNEETMTWICHQEICSPACRIFVMGRFFGVLFLIIRGLLQSGCYLFIIWNNGAQRLGSFSEES